MVRAILPPHLWPAAEKLSLGAMRGAGVLLVAFLGGAAALTGTCENWYAHPRTCHRPSVGETQWLEALLPVALCPAQRSVPDALALNLYPLPASLSTPASTPMPVLHEHRPLFSALCRALHCMLLACALLRLQQMPACATCAATDAQWSHL